MYTMVSTRACLALGIVVASAIGGSPAFGDAGYADYDTLTETLRGLASSQSDACTLSSFGTSRQNRELWVLTLGRGGDRSNRLAMVIVAGIDGNNPATTSTAVSVAQSLLSAEEGEPGWELLTERIVYVIPRVNSDAMESFFANPRYEQRAALRPFDDDRDGSVDEDGPEDLDGDGLITMMRVPWGDRNLVDLKATHLPDPEEPRLLKEADPAEGEKAVYVLLTEGIDNDGDEAYNEDGLGGVDLNRNFMHEYKEHDAGAGPHQLSEPETKALIDFFFEHPRIAMAVFYGRHDNIVDVAAKDKPGARGKTPGSDQDGETGRRFMRFRRRPRRPEKATTGLHKDDVPIYRQISEKYRKITGVKKVPPEPADGAVFAWAYAQYGVPSFACRLWMRPDLEEGGEKAAEAETDEGKQGADEALVPEERSTAAGEGTESDAAMKGSHGEQGGQEDGSSAEPRKRRKGGPRTDEKEAEKTAADKEAAAWLKYSDEQREGAGFVPWAPFDHPQLGEIEIGGFVPFFRITPPPTELEAIAEKQLAFVLDLAERFPDISIVPPKVTRLSETLYEIETELVNDGYFPLGLAIAKLNRRVRPIVVSLDIEQARVRGGERVVKIWSIPGSGGRHRLRWVVQGEPDSTVTLKMNSEKYGDALLDVVLTPTAEEGGGS